MTHASFGNLSNFNQQFNTLQNRPGIEWGIDMTYSALGAASKNIVTVDSRQHDKRLRHISLFVINTAWPTSIEFSSRKCSQVQHPNCHPSVCNWTHLYSHCGYTLTSLHWTAVYSVRPNIPTSRNTGQKSERTIVMSHTAYAHVIDLINGCSETRCSQDPDFVYNIGHERRPPRNQSI